MEAPAIVQWLETKFPDELPYEEVSSFELGVLIGQQQVINDLKVKLKLTDVKEQEER